MYSLSGISFNLGDRYEGQKFLGAGAYGYVIKAQDKVTKELVAIKKLHKVEDIIDAKRILREIRILRTFKNLNILELKDVIFIPNEEGFGEVYLVTNLMQIDLYHLIKTKQALTDDHIQYILYQLLRALLYLHSANVIHRDLKPSNVLATEECDIQICDFGLARIIDFNAEENLTEYVVTRYYRAPEIMLSSHEYSKAVDIWSLGCTIAELVTGKVLFPGQNYIQQIKLIIDTMGKPSEMAFVTNPNAKKYLDSLNSEPTTPLLTKVKYPNPDFLDLLSKMLEVNPAARITAKEALAHPYLKSLHDPMDEPEFKGEADFKFENDPNITLDEIKSAIIDEINLFKIKNKEPTFDKAKILSGSMTTKMDPKFLKLQETQMKNAHDDIMKPEK